MTRFLTAICVTAAAILGNLVETVRVQAYYNRIAFKYASTPDGKVSFGGDSSFAALPADFFGPGSLPFEGIVPLQDASGNTTVIINQVMEKSGTEGINIGVGELQECTISKSVPIIVNFGDGSTQPWDVMIGLNRSETSRAMFEFTNNPLGTPDGGRILPVDSFFDIFAEVTFSHTPSSGPIRFRSFSIVDRTQLTTTDANWARRHNDIAGGADRKFVPGADPADPSAPLQVLLFDGGGLDFSLRVVDVVPEPSSLMLVALGACLFACRLRRRF